MHYKLLIIILSLFLSLNLNAEPAPISKVTEYLKLIGYEELVSSNLKDCISRSMDMKPNDKELLINSISSIETQRKLKPGTLILDKSKFNILITKLNSQYKVFVNERCNLSKDEDKLVIFATEYAKYLTNEDIDAILSFARSPAGKKDIIASQKGIENAYKIIWASQKIKQQKMNDAYSDKIVKIISKYLVFKKE